MSEFPDIESLRLKPEMVGEVKPKKGPPEPAKGERFLYKVPWGWWATAAKLPSKAALVASGVWLIARLEKSATVRWRPKIGKALGLNRLTVYRGLAALEAAGLVRVERHRGRCPLVTLLPYNPKGD